MGGGAGVFLRTLQKNTMEGVACAPFQSRGEQEMMDTTKVDPVDRYRSLLECYAGMVGTLYPSIAYNELLGLWEGNEAIRKRWGHPPEPRCDGSAPHVSLFEYGPAPVLF
jgi:hypothetical protein